MTPPSPTDQFGRLNLEDPMPVTTRGQAAREEARELTEAQSSQPGAPNGSRVKSSRTEITYNVRNLSPEAKQRVEAGLRRARCKLASYRDVPESDYCIFELDERVVVRFGKEGSRYHRPGCTCGAAEGGLACKHIFWLEDQLVNAVPAPPPVPELRPDGSSVTGKTPFELIRELGLDEFAESVYEAEEEYEPSDMEQLNDMLSVFEPRALPEEFAEEDFGTEADDQFPSLVYKQFGTLIAHRAANDERLWNRLHGIITRAVMANAYFKKIRDRADQTFRDLDDSIEEDPSNEEAILACARTLKDYVDLIQSNYDERIPDIRTGGQESANRAVAALVHILEEVVNRRGLYDRLIGRPAERGGLFVLDFLNKVPPEVVENSKGQLSRVLQTLRSYGAPVEYLNRLRGIISKRAAPAPATGGESSSGKRVMR